jgi:phage/plasmid-like protein (TIGR03299 family)
MAHGIQKNSDFVFKGELAWHGLGVKPKNGIITKEFLLNSSTFNHRVEKVPFKYQDGTDSETTFYLLTDDGHIINDSVGARYNVFQTEDILRVSEPIMELYDVETAGRLFHGKKVFITFKLKESIKVGNGDAIDNYVVLADSRDGKVPRLYLTPVRVVCNNTLGLSMSQIASESGPLRHTENLITRVEDAIVVMNLIREQAEKTESIFSKMLNVEINMIQMMGDLMLDKEAAHKLINDGELATKTKNVMLNILKSYTSGAGQDIAPNDSAWKAYNGVTHFVSHIKNYKNNDAKMQNVLWGADKKFMQEAMDYCLVEQKPNDIKLALSDVLFN